MNTFKLEGLGRTKMVIEHMYSPGDLENDLKRFRYFWHMFRAASDPLSLTPAAWQLHTATGRRHKVGLSEALLPAAREVHST